MAYGDRKTCTGITERHWQEEDFDGMFRPFHQSPSYTSGPKEIIPLKTGKNCTKAVKSCSFCCLIKFQKGAQKQDEDMLGHSCEKQRYSTIETHDTKIWTYLLTFKVTCRAFRLQGNHFSWCNSLRSFSLVTFQLIFRFKTTFISPRFIHKSFSWS